ncbi:MAG: hypothetical protein NC084_01720 [Bacteroides sp.]|nr:hypothetical protein [Eubacterium sp.]MCM1417395.1 hypothetical protein [Roseburia sp.]MCM1461412.1 hypothetical protein [Bacteroides sp.]
MRKAVCRFAEKRGGSGRIFGNNIDGAIKVWYNTIIKKGGISLKNRRFIKPVVCASANRQGSRKKQAHTPQGRGGQSLLRLSAQTASEGKE